MKQSNETPAITLNPMEIYMRDISRYSPLSEQQEKELGARAFAGEQDARNRLTESNLPLVMAIAKRFTGRGVAFEDLIQEGNEGLMRAAEGYDPSNDNKFGTYAAYWIKQRIKMAIVNQARIVRVPAGVQQAYAMFRRALVKLQVTEAELSDERKVEIIKGLKFQRHHEHHFADAEHAQCVSLTHETDDAENEEIADGAQLDGADAAAFEDELDEALTALRTLPDVEQDAIILRFVEGKKQSELAPILGLRPRQVPAYCVRVRKKLQALIGEKDELGATA